MLLSETFMFWQMVSQLNVPTSAMQLTDAFLAKAAQLCNLIPGGHRIGTPEVLFREISPEIEAHLRQRWRDLSVTSRSIPMPTQDAILPVIDRAKR